MANTNTHKKRVVVKLQNLPDELQDTVRKQYPHGFSDHMIRIDKGPGDFFYAVVFETENTNYLIKIDVNIDGQIDEEEEKDFFGDDMKGADEIEDNGESDEEEE